MSRALVAANKSAINQGDAETGRINPYLWVLDDLVSAITKTAYRKPEKSSVQLKKYMIRWLKANLQKLRKKYTKYNCVSKMDTKALNYYAVKGAHCLQREELMDLEVIRSHHLHNHRGRRISQPDVRSAVQIVRNVDNEIRPVVTNFQRTFTNAFCAMQTAELKGLPEDGQRAQAAVVPVERPKRHRVCKHRQLASVGVIVCAEGRNQRRRQQQRRPRRQWW
ncbi:hypothetical protein SprV_0702285000 [Sparganum proliferum]